MQRGGNKIMKNFTTLKVGDWFVTYFGAIEYVEKQTFEGNFLTISGQRLLPNGNFYHNPEVNFVRFLIDKPDLTPLKKEKKITFYYQWVLKSKSFKRYSITFERFESEDMVKLSLHDTNELDKYEVIEPYLPSQIEIEV